MVEVTIPDKWPLWSLQRFPEAPGGLIYACRQCIPLAGHLVDVVGLGETAQQAVDECGRASDSLRARVK